MKQFMTKASAFFIFATMTACSEDAIVEFNPNLNNSEFLQAIKITGKDFQHDDETRSSVSITESGASFTWDEDDVIGIFPNEGDQVSFAMDNGAGTQTATFSGGGWALKSSATYAAYYPHVYENRDMTKIPVSYVGQIQNGNANNDHIGAYDFMAASVSTPSNGAVAFDMQHLGCLVQLQITVPEPATLSKITINSSTYLTETGIIDLSKTVPTIVANTKSNVMEIEITNITTTKTNEIVTMYFMMAPVDLSSSTLTATLSYKNGITHATDVMGKNLKAGKAYQLIADFSQSNLIDYNQIWYTSSDGNIVTPNASAFGENIISNIYENGKGIITFDGDITTLGESAFRNCTTLTTVTIPDRVTTIDRYAFYQCNSLITVVLPNSLDIIKEDAFAYCVSLSDFTIPKRVTNIGRSAFHQCKSLTNITIPSSVTCIENNPFTWCTSLESIVVEQDNSVYDSRNNCNAIIETSSNKMICGCKNTEIPNSIVSIAGAFVGCESLTSITIPNSVTTINGAFASCTSLSDITIPNSVTIIGDYAFENCTSFTDITIPESVIEIGCGAFLHCISLVSVNVKAKNPPSLTYEGFFDCNNYFKVYVPAESFEIYKKTDYWKYLNLYPSN